LQTPINGLERALGKKFKIEDVAQLSIAIARPICDSKRKRRKTLVRNVLYSHKKFAALYWSCAFLQAS
jgi:hypothetical protein